jgi:uncharacterized membrane protein YgcG
MPTDEEPNDVNKPGNGPTETTPAPGSPVADDGVRPVESAHPAVLASRWIDYDTHELLEMISELEDERRWARFREGIWIAILFHFLLLSAVTWVPKYVLNAPQVIDPIDAIKNRKDLTYLDMPTDALRNLQPKLPGKPMGEKPPVIDKKTIEAIKRATPPPTSQPQSQPAPQQSSGPTLPQQPVSPSQQSQSQLEAPRPAAVPARPNFAMNTQNPADQLRDAMKGASRNRGGMGGGGGFGGGGGSRGGGGLSRHPGAGGGGVQILSDTQGVDFNGWLQRWHRETERTWDPLIPDEVNPPILKSGMVAIRFKVLPNGRLMDGSMVLAGRSGDPALDRAAWGALTGSNYPPLPRDFHGPYLELRAYFMYNMERPH